jgi:hypothetical protein
MKYNIKLLLLFFALVASYTICPKQALAQQSSVSFQTFYDELSPYGEWVDYPRYGYVWIPDVGSGFEPYSTDGQWVMTDYGWTWVSDYEWGWAPFHYGRWDYDNYYGWLWVPDSQWGPSWVTWVRSDGYYGWQPMQPGISISLSFGRDYRTNSDHWNFVRDRDFQRSNVSRYYVSQSNSDVIIRNSTVINNTYTDNRRNSTYVSGPARDDVQRNTGKRVSSVAIRENSNPGQSMKNGQLQIYRPDVRKNNDSGSKPVPNRITNKEDVKRPAERNTINQRRNVSPTNNGRQQQQRQNNIKQQNIDKSNAQPVQRQEVDRSENNRQQRQQRQNTINQQNIEKGNTQREQQQNVNQPENKKPNERQPVDLTPANKRNAVQPSQQQKGNTPQNNVREQRQIKRQEKNVRNNQEKVNKSQENKRREE